MQVVPQNNIMLDRHGLVVVEPLAVARHVRGGPGVEVPDVGFIHSHIVGCSGDESSVLKVVNS